MNNHVVYRWVVFATLNVLFRSEQHVCEAGGTFGAFVVRNEFVQLLLDTTRLQQFNNIGEQRKTCRNSHKRSLFGQLCPLCSRLQACWAQGKAVSHSTRSRHESVLAPTNQAHDLGIRKYGLELPFSYFWGHFGGNTLGHIGGQGVMGFAVQACITTSYY